MSQQPNWTRTAALAGALFLLGGGAYWLEFTHKPKREDAAEAEKKLFNLKDAPVERVAIAGGAQSFELTCLDVTAKLCKAGDNSRWQLEKPARLNADAANGNALLSALNNLVISESIDLKDETPEKRTQLLKEYGLDPASRSTAGKRLTVKTTSSQTILHLGLNHPIGEGMFGLVERDGKVDETRVYIVPSYFKVNFERDLTYWREKKLLSIVASEVNAFDLQGSKSKVVGRREETQGSQGAQGTQGGWTLSSGGQEFSGDVENIDALVSAAAFLTAKGFLGKDALSGAKPVLKLELTASKSAAPAPTPSPGASPAPKPAAAGESARAMLTLYSKKDKAGEKLLATVEGADPVFDLDPSVRERLDRRVEDLRQAKLITSIERFTLKKIAFSGGPFAEKPLEVTNQDGKWIDQAKNELSLDKVQGLLDRLSGNRVKDFIAQAKVPADVARAEKDAVVFSLTDDKADPKRKIAFWRSSTQPDAKLYARDLLAKRAEIMVIDPVLMNDMPWTGRDHFKKPEPGAKASGAPAAAAASAPAGAVDPHGHSH